MDYLALKALQQSAAALSFAGFFAPGLAALLGAPWVRGRAARTLPHLVDTVLLLSALALASTLRLQPAATPWLAAKIIGLVVYIALGVLALRPGRARGVRAAAWVATLLAFGYIVSVALTKDPAGLLLLVGQAAMLPWAAGVPPA